MEGTNVTGWDHETTSGAGVREGVAAPDVVDRARFVESLEHALVFPGELPVSVIVLDLDRFTTVNHQIGRAGGDHVLDVVAHRILAAVRSADVVGRLGVDEFGVVCRHRHPGDAEAFAERLLRSITEPIDVLGRTISVGASAGVASTAEGRSADSVLREAGQALYDAKANGRSRVVVFSRADRRHDDQADDARQLRIGIERGELVVEFQPEIDLTTGRCETVEALIRWEHPERGRLAPSAFVPLAEERGLIGDLGSTVLRMACEEVGRIQGQGADRLELAVNVSALEFGHPDFVASLVRVLSETGFDPADLCLELTETTLVVDAERAVVTLGEIADLGVRVAIDDFGTGYSSLSYLSRFPVDYVKIDQSFLRSIHRDPATQAVVSAVVNLSHALDFVVVAEGVETEEQLGAAYALGVDRGQGFWWSRARALDDVVAWDQARRGSRGWGEQATVGSVARSVVAEHRTRTRRDIRLQVFPAAESIGVDRLAVSRCLDHLVDNACKFSADGTSVTITVDKVGDGVSMAVRNHGPDLSPQERVRCFEQFWQATPRRTGGVGLGLYEARSMVESIGGRLAVTSRDGATTFTAFVPRR